MYVCVEGLVCAWQVKVTTVGGRREDKGVRGRAKSMCVVRGPPCFFAGSWTLGSSELCCSEVTCSFPWTVHVSVQFSQAGWSVECQVKEFRVMN